MFCSWCEPSLSISLPLANRPPQVRAQGKGEGEPPLPGPLPGPHAHSAQGGGQLSRPGAAPHSPRKAFEALAKRPSED